MFFFSFPFIINNLLHLEKKNGNLKRTKKKKIKIKSMNYQKKKNKIEFFKFLT